MNKRKEFINRYFCIIKYLLVSVLVVILLFFGLNLIFSEYGMDEATGLGMMLIVVYFFVAGGVIGFMTRVHWHISGFSVWSLAIIGLKDKKTLTETGLLGLILVFTLGGAFFGSHMRKKVDRCVKYCKKRFK